MKKFFSLNAIIMFGLGLSGVMAQQAILTSGGEATGSGGTASYSVGQLVYSTHAGTNGTEAQGVQQPFEISLVVGIEEAAAITCSFVAYPNPTQGVVTIKTNGYDYAGVKYQLTDVNGRLISTAEIVNTEQPIDLGNFEPNIYFIRLAKQNNEIKVFKIIKN